MDLPHHPLKAILGLQGTKPHAGPLPRNMSLPEHIFNDVNEIPQLRRFIRFLRQIHELHHRSPLPKPKPSGAAAIIAQAETDEKGPPVPLDN